MNERYAHAVASIAAFGHPYNSLCYPGNARWSEIAAEFHAMGLEVPCEISSVVAALLAKRLPALQEDMAAALHEHFELGITSSLFRLVAPSIVDFLHLLG